MTRSIYATVVNRAGEPIRIGAHKCVQEGIDYALVWVVGSDSRGGLYRLERFEGSRLTVKTLQQFFGMPAGGN